MPKWLKLLVGVLLIPVCIGTSRTLWRVIEASGRADSIWVSLLAGAGCWFVVFLLLPRPMWVYVFGHELTHAVWAWLFGARVKRFRATARGGHVVLSRTNFVIGLAPYFFPVYAFLVVLVFVAGHLLWDWTRYQIWFHLLLGAAYAFHVTMTFHILQTRQSDITEQGLLFSAVVIWMGNLSVLLLGIPLLTGIPLRTTFELCTRLTTDVFLDLARMF